MIEGHAKRSAVTDHWFLGGGELKLRCWRQYCLIVASLPRYPHCAEPLADRPTHAEHAQGVLFVDRGSVAKPKDGDPRGACAIPENQNGGLRVTIERASYDAEPVAEDVRRAGLPGEFADILTCRTPQLAL